MTYNSVEEIFETYCTHTLQYKNVISIELSASAVFAVAAAFFTSFAVQRMAESDKVWSLNSETYENPTESRELNILGQKEPYKND